MLQITLPWVGGQPDHRHCKLLGGGIAGRWLGWSRLETRMIGWLLQTKTLIMIIFANVLLDKVIISPEMFTALILMAVALAETMPCWYLR